MDNLSVSKSDTYFSRGRIFSRTWMYRPQYVHICMGSESSARQSISQILINLTWEHYALSPSGFNTF